MLKRIVLTALLILTFSGAAHAQDGVHLNALLNRRFPVSKAAYVLSGSPHPAFSIVWKSYGNRTKNLSNILELLTSPTVYNKPTVHVIVYGSCGPCRPPRRPWGLFPIVVRQGVGTLNRNLERNDPKTLAEFEREWTALNSIMPAMPGVTYIFEEELEDNFTDRAYLNLHNVSEKVFAGRSDVEFGRNSISGVQIIGHYESHDMYDYSYFYYLDPGSIMGADGFNARLPGETTGTSTRIVRRWILAARRHKLIALIYRSETQGLPPVSATTRILLPPNRRTYKFSNQKALHDLLK